MNNLRALILTQCNNLPFILALNPKENPSKLVLCPNLEKILLYIKSQDQFHIEHLVSMMKNRASRGTKLSSIKIIGLSKHAPDREVFELRKHVAHVGCRVGGKSA